MRRCRRWRCWVRTFSALQRAEIAEMVQPLLDDPEVTAFSALQRAEIAEIAGCQVSPMPTSTFSALQRAEIAEIARRRERHNPVLRPFSALQRAEIAEIARRAAAQRQRDVFQCSSTSRNC